MGLAKFGGQITFEELSTKKTKSLKISQNVRALFEQILQFCLFCRALLECYLTIKLCKPS